MKTMYLVLGKCGLFDDIATWPVAVIDQQIEAELYASKANEAAKDIEERMILGNPFDAHRAKLDPDLEEEAFNHGDVRYTVVPVKVARWNSTTGDFEWPGK